MSIIDEEKVELQSLEWFKEIGYTYKNGYEISPEGKNPERIEFKEVILEERLKSFLIQFLKFLILIFQIYLFVIEKFIRG